MKVAVIDTQNGTVFKIGETDGKLVDGFYLHVDGTLYHAAQCFDAQHVEYVSTKCALMQKDLQKMHNDQYKQLLELRRDYGVKS